MDRSKWTDLRWAQKASEARVILEKEPHLLTDAQIQMLDDIDDGGPLYRQRRDAAQLAKLPKPVPMAASTARSGGFVTAAEFNKNFWQLPVLVGTSLAAVLKPIKTEQWALGGRVSKLEIKLDTHVEREQSAGNGVPVQEKSAPSDIQRLEAIEARLTKLEQSRFDHIPDYEVGKTYVKDACVRHSSSLWQCRVDSTSATPGGNLDWLLVVRRGKGR